jgi:Ca2+-transporting ATPase
LPALSLGVEKNEKDVMKKKPRRANSNFLSDGVGFSILYQGIIQGLITLCVYYIGITNYSHEIGMTMAFMTLGLIQLAHSFNAKSSTKSIFEVGIFSNMYLIFGNVIAVFFQIIVVFVPYLREIFKVELLDSEQWGIVTLAALSIIPIVEVVKLIRRISVKREI